jgi:hypothetical protein
VGDSAGLVIFVGPTLHSAELPPLPHARFLPPAAQGDLYRATIQEPAPRAILLIDGYFRACPAVRHKEILWALTGGIHVFGAASMGALRAAELAPFGMVGIGAVFEAFHKGLLEDDDEVAIEHGPAELGYPQVSEAMVDIRATLKAAEAEGVIGPVLEARLLEIAKRMFYARRSYPALLEAVLRESADPIEVEHLWQWLPIGRKSIKREDALLAVAAGSKFVAGDPAPFRPAFRLVRTEMWAADVAPS